jgi:hypothetical protein
MDSVFRNNRDNFVERITSSSWLNLSLMTFTLDDHSLNLLWLSPPRLQPF